MTNEENQEETEITEAEGLEMYSDLIRQAEGGDRAAFSQMLDLIDANDHIFLKAVKIYLKDRTE